MKPAYSLVALVLLTPGNASAGPDARRAAAEEFGAAREAFARHDYREAAVHFDEADRLAPEPRARFDAAVAWDRAGDAPRAADRYASALPLLAGRDRETAVARLEVLERRIGVLRVEGRPDLRVDVGGSADLALPASLHLAAGAHDVRIHGPAFDRTRSIDIRPGQTFTLHLDEAPSAPPPAAPAIGPAPPPAPTTQAEPRRSIAAPIAMSGVAAGFAVAGVVFDVLGLRARDALVASARTDADARDRAVTYRAVAFGAFGVAAVSAAVAMWLYLRAPAAQRNSHTSSVP